VVEKESALRGLLLGALVLLVLLSGDPALAQEDDLFEDEFELLREEEIVYAASKHEQDIGESPSAITVITREQIENTHCTDVICILRQVPEVDVRRVFPMYSAAGVRALTGELGDKILVLVDGREENHDVFGMAYWQILPVHLQEIERIEVIRGPGSALYGANAHSGVISITTRKAGENLAEAYLGGGERDRNSLFLRINRRFGDWSAQVSASLDTQGHWRIRDEREREILRARLRVDHRGGDSETSLQLGMIVPEGTIFTTMAPAHAYDTILANLVASHRVGFFKAAVWMGIWDVTLRPDLPMYFAGMKLGEFTSDTHFFNSALDAEAQAELEPFSGNLLIAGANYRWITMLSDQLTPGELNQHRVGVFVHDEQRLFENLILSGGIRFDYNSITPWTLSPRLAATWRFAESQWLRLAAGRAFRKPTFFNTSMHFKNVRGEPGFDELTDFFLRSIGYEDLENESLTAFEIGYRGRFLQKKLTIEADAFFNLYRDTLNFIVDMVVNDLGMPDLTESAMGYRNAGRDVDALGGSLEVVFQPEESWSISANYTLRYSWWVEGAWEGYGLEGDVGERVSWERAHLANLSVSYLPEQGLRWGAAVHFGSAFDQMLPETGLVFDENALLHCPAHLVIGGFAAFRLPVGTGFWELGLKVYNVANAGFRDSVSVVRPDGNRHGGELLGRRLFLYLRGSI
jgi:outer membrane receptor for ferrienterochelin and colicin